MATKNVETPRATPNADANKAAVGTKKHLVEQMKPVDLTINGVPLIASPMEFSSGNVGWNCNGKMTMKLADGTAVTVQIGLNLTVIGSKKLPTK